MKSNNQSKISKLPIDLQFKIDSYYNKYQSLFNLVLYDIYNPYKTIYNQIVLELRGQINYTGKSKWLKLEEHLQDGNKIVTRKVLKLNYNSINMLYRLILTELTTGKKIPIYPKNLSDAIPLEQAMTAYLNLTN